MFTAIIVYLDHTQKPTGKDRDPRRNKVYPVGVRRGGFQVIQSRLVTH